MKVDVVLDQRIDPGAANRLYGLLFTEADQRSNLVEDPEPETEDGGSETNQ